MPNLNRKSKSVKLPDRVLVNLGCGSNKIPDYVNIDMEKTLKPDVCIDFSTQPLPFKNGTVDEVVMFHTIEHIRKRFHRFLFSEIRRVLKPNSRVIVSYPIFSECYKRWESNYKGQKDFWEATMFGRQMFPADFHVCAMEPAYLTPLLKSVGYQDIRHKREPYPNEFSGITVATRSRKRDANYEELIRASKYTLKRVK